MVACTLALWVFAKMSSVSCLTVFAIDEKSRDDAMEGRFEIVAGVFEGKGIL